MSGLGHGSLQQLPLAPGLWSFPEGRGVCVFLGERAALARALAHVWTQLGAAEPQCVTDILMGPGQVTGLAPATGRDRQCGDH